MTNVFYRIALIVLIFAIALSWSKEFTKKISPMWLEYDEAVKQAKENDKFILAKLYADWCGPCRMMDEVAFADPRVVKLIDDNFLATKLNVESKEIISCDNWPRATVVCVSQNWEVQGIPTIMIIGPSGYSLIQVSQYLDANEMKTFLTNLISNKKLLKETDAETVKMFKDAKK